LSQPTNKIRYRPFEKPLGKIAGYLAEPEPGFVDPYESEEREAIQELEREEEIRIDYHAKRAKRIEIAQRLERTDAEQNQSDRD
jgi:hypothetical protein